MHSGVGERSRIKILVSFFLSNIIHDLAQTELLCKGFCVWAVVKREQSSRLEPNSLWYDYKMSYLYHMVPRDMVGTILHPLTTLKEEYPEVYAAHMLKYRGREHVMDFFIPPLRCHWNDVVHLSPVEPAELIQALRDAGMENKTFAFYKIDTRSLVTANLVVYLFTNLYQSAQPDASEFVSFHEELTPELSRVNEATKEYFRKRIADGTLPLFFAGIPHVLYKGSIDVSAAQIVSV